MEFFEQEVQTETRPATFWEKLEVWTSLPIPEVIRNHMEQTPRECGEGLATPTHWNPISGALYYGEHDCPVEETL